MYSFCYVPFLGMCSFRNVPFFGMCFFGMCLFWKKPFLECAFFGMCPFWNVPFLEYAFFGICKNYELRISEAMHKLRKYQRFPNLNSFEPPYFCSVKCVLQVDEYQFVGPPLWSWSSEYKVLKSICQTHKKWCQQTTFCI